MSILRTPDYGENVKALIRTAADELAIVSAFATTTATEAILRNVAPTVRRKELHVRWQADDLLSGASELAVYEVARDHGVAMFMQPTLHAKFVIADRTRVIIGSANVTGRGLGLTAAGNIEAGVMIEPTLREIHILEEIMCRSTLVTPDLFDQLRNYVERNRMPPKLVREFTGDISSVLTGQFTGLWVRDLPLQPLPPSRGGDPTVSWDVELENQFAASKCLRWVRTLLPPPDYAIYFGELTSSLHDTLLEDPTPYRTEVKKLVSNLMSWCVELLPDEFGSDTPNYSQRLYRKHSGSER